MRIDEILNAKFDLDFVSGICLSWKKENVTIYKKGKKKGLGNCRLVSIVSESETVMAWIHL